LTGTNFYGTINVAMKKRVAAKAWRYDFIPCLRIAPAPIVTIRRFLIILVWI